MSLDCALSALGRDWWRLGGPDCDFIARHGSYKILVLLMMIRWLPALSDVGGDTTFSQMVRPGNEATRCCGQRARYRKIRRCLKHEVCVKPILNAVKLPECRAAVPVRETIRLLNF